MQIGHVNIWSLLAPIKENKVSTDKNQITKFVLIKAHMLHHEYNIFGISETWLDNLDYSNDLMIPGYLAPIRMDNNGNQGGVLVNMSVNVPAQHRKDLEPPNYEIIVVELQLKNTKVLICNCYRPPPHIKISLILLLTLNT